MIISSKLNSESLNWPDFQIVRIGELRTLFREIIRNISDICVNIPAHTMRRWLKVSTFRNYLGIKFEIHHFDRRFGPSEESIKRLMRGYTIVKS